MKIFFDGGIFSSQKTGGISRLNFELIKALGGKKDVRQTFYHGFHVDRYPFKKEWFQEYYGVKKPFSYTHRSMNFLDNMAMELAHSFNNSPDVIFHALYYRLPKNHRGPVVVHAYDMIQELFGGSQKTIAFKKKSFERADLIIAISESTKKDICQLYPIDPGKVIIAYPGVSEVFFNRQNASKKSGVRPYMLYVGARNYKYKNFDLLLNAFIDKKYFRQFDLVVFGGEKNLSTTHGEAIKRHHGGDWLKQGFGSDEKLAGLYANAAVFIYPSLYEGFGIPPLEAMASGCPVVASNTSSIPEAVGDASLLFNPKDPNDLAEKIGQVINRPSLKSDLVKKGKIRARQFTWEGMANTIYRAYISLLKNKNV